MGEWVNKEDMWCSRTWLVFSKLLRIYVSSQVNEREIEVVRNEESS